MKYAYFSKKRCCGIAAFGCFLMLSGCDSGGNASYTVGGTVRGLAETGLVLQNNGGDDLNVAGNSFTFAVPVDNGSDYAVTVRKQPGTQQCTVTNGRGRISGANVVDVEVTCRGWGEAQVIDTNGETDGWEPQIAFDDAGNAIAVWSRASLELASNRYTAGSGWGVPETVESGAGDPYMPQLAVDGDGNAVAVWVQEDVRNDIWANHYVAGAGWGSPLRLENDNVGGAIQPQVASDRDGNTVAVWKQGDGVTVNIYANRYTPGTGWSGRELLESAGDPADAPDVAVDGGGNAIAVWAQREGTTMSIWANRYTSAAGWGEAQVIGRDGAEDAGEPQIAMDGSGRAWVVWQQSDGVVTSLWANRYTPDDGWGTATPLEDDDAGSIYAPTIAVDRQGNAVALWGRNAGVDYGVWANRYVAGTGWVGATQISRGQPGDVVEPRVALGPAGNAMILWSEYDGSRYSLWSSHFDPGTGWSAPGLVEHLDGGNVYAPQLAFDGVGNVMAVWAQSDGSWFTIWSNRFN